MSPDEPELDAELDAPPTRRELGQQVALGAFKGVPRPRRGQQLPDEPEPPDDPIPAAELQKPWRTDSAFEAEARAMQKAMDTGELPPKSAPYHDRVKRLAQLHHEAIAAREKRGGRP
jgi:hypothetical protein